MVYIDPEELKWFPYVKTWMQRKGGKMQVETQDFILDLFNRFVEKGLVFVNKKCQQAIPTVDISKVGRKSS
jgi:dynein heavy chain